MHNSTGKKERHLTSQNIATKNSSTLWKIPFIAGMILSILLMFAACKQGVCHHCGDPLDDDPLEAGGRNYCSYNCYMQEFLFN